MSISAGGSLSAFLVLLFAGEAPNELSLLSFSTRSVVTWTMREEVFFLILRGVLAILQGVSLGFGSGGRAISESGWGG